MQAVDFNNSPPHISSHSDSNLWVFFGGFFYNLFFSIHHQYTITHTSLFDYIFSQQGIEYIIHSVIGGFIALAFKLLFVFIKDVLLNRKSSSSSENSNPPQT